LFEFTRQNPQAQHRVQVIRRSGATVSVPLVAQVGELIERSRE
jgi:hypothetical protein